MIKSFEVDHTQLKAPTIRLADIYTKDGVMVKKYDLRFIQPNAGIMEDAMVHSMEHLMATAFKEEFKDDMIDLSPMGCKTGFYCTMFANHSEKDRIIRAMEESINAEIPIPNEKNCGSYKMHDIEGARAFLKEITKQLKGDKEND